MTKKRCTVAAALIALTASTPVPVNGIHLDQLGFTPDGPKRAIVTTAATKPLPWTLVDTTGRPVANGVTTVIGPDVASGDTVHLIDFGQVTRAGDYRLDVANAKSHIFPIRAGIFRPLATASLNYFYQTRAGIPIEARWAGGAAWGRPAGHPHEIASCFSGPDEAGNVWTGCPYKLNVTGGWYDAGDQGKYVVNGGIALWTLQNLWETQPAARTLFADGGARLPEVSNGKPDLLDEARWEMQFLLAMQVPDGTHLQLPVGPQPRGAPLRFRDVDAGGMAHHKVADRHWTPLPTPPASDPEPRLLFPPSTAATLNLAATAAQCARVWRSVDPAFSATCLHAAERAWAAAKRNPAIHAAQAFTGSGGYGDEHLDDEFFWAAAELFATTGEGDYGTVVRGSRFFTGAVGTPDWSNTAALGTITLATAAGGLSPTEQRLQRALIVAAADRFLGEEMATGYRLPFADTHYAWGSNAVILNRAVLLGLAAQFTNDSRYRAGATDALDYVLGRNPLDRSFVTGFGWNPILNPHHRFWTHQLDPGQPGPPPGVMSGGPNSHPADPTALAALKGCAPQRCWVDDARAYSVNEVAINWNAPLTWVATYLGEPARP